MKTNRFIPVAATQLFLIFDACLSTAFAQGNLTPPGAPAPTMKTLDQIEARTPISSVPYTITNPGSYYLTANVSVTGGNAITIAANGVILDLNGFTISSTVNPFTTGYGILINSGLNNLTIKNGFIQGGTTDSGNGFFTGHGFGYGVEYSGTQPANVIVSHVSVIGTGVDGINLGNGNSVVESCTVNTAPVYGIVASIIRNCMATDCGLTAISGSEVSDSQGSSPSSVDGGDGIYAMTANNCYGYSNSGYGVVATAANNCYGNSNSGYGGLNAFTANNCYGSGGTGYGLGADLAMNCEGISNSGTGLTASYVAISCYGSSNTGTGLRTEIANSCVGTSISYSYHYNMPP